MPAVKKPRRIGDSYLINPDKLVMLKHIAKALKVSKAVLIRRGIDHILETNKDLLPEAPVANPPAPPAPPAPPTS